VATSKALPQIIEIRHNEYRQNDGAHYTVTQIGIFIGGMWFYKDLTSDRDYRLAERLAKDSNIELRDLRKIQEKSNG
jgi:hypothetical protein